MTIPLCLIICGNSMSYFAKTSICLRYLNNCLQNVATFEHGAITTVFKRSFTQAFAAKFRLVWFWVLTAICFATQTNHFRAAEFFFEDAKGSCIVLFMLSAASSRDELCCWFGWIFNPTVSASQRVPSFFHCWTDTVIRIVLGQS